MGNILGGSSRIYYHIKQSSIEIIIPDKINQSLTSIVRTYSKDDFRITLPNLCILLNMNFTSKFTKKFLHIFTDSKNGFTYKTLSYFFMIFRATDQNSILLKALITELLFGKKDKVPHKKIQQRQTFFLPNLPIHLAQSATNNENEIISKQSFLENNLSIINSLRKTPTYQLTSPLCTLFKGISEITNPSIRYYCDCLKQQNVLNEHELIKHYTQLKGYFDYNIKGKNKTVLPIEEFELKFKGKINDIVLHYAMSYFKKASGKNFISFEMFIQFFIGFHLTKMYDEKVAFFFRMMSYPKKALSLGELEKKMGFKGNVLGDEFNEKEIQNVDEKLFKEISPIIFKHLKINFNDIVEEIGLLPYSLFRLQPTEGKIKQYMIKEFMKKKSLDEYFEEHFHKETLFYIIPSSFWHSFDSNYNGPIPKEIDISSLLYNPIIYKEILKDGLIYKNDFYLFPKSLYDYTMRYFPLKQQVYETEEEKNVFVFQLCFEKQIINGKLQKKQIGEFEYNLPRGTISYQKEENLIEEIDTYPKLVIIVNINNYIEEVSKKTGYHYVTQDAVVETIKKRICHNTDKYYLLTKNQSIKRIKPLNRKRILNDYINEFKKEQNFELKLYYPDIEYNKLHIYDENNSNTVESFTNERLLILFGCVRQSDGSFYSDFLLMEGGKEKVKILDKEYVRNLKNKQREKELQLKKNKQQGMKLSKEEEELNQEKQKQEEENERKITKEEEEKLKEEKRKQKEEEEKERKRQKELDEKILVAPFGLYNLGNTCYFNSIIQMFINLPPVKVLFNDSKLKYFINKKNKFGQKGKFINKFLSLYNQNRVSLRSTLSDIHKYIGKINENFDNFDQQDASEFLITLIEIFHEELNLKTERKYIENKDLIELNKEQCSNIYWANSLRRSVSFINALFMFQIKSTLICQKCKTAKISYEQNYIMDLPISEGPIVTITIELSRLPLCYKIYLDKVNMKFRKFHYENKERSIVQNLKLFASTLDSSSQVINSYKNYFTLSAPVCFTFEIERNKRLKDLFSKIRRNEDLELEPDNDEIVYTDTNGNKCKINGYTSFVIISTNGDILDIESEITTYVGNNNSVTFYVYEVLNSNGMHKLKECYLNKIVNGEIKEDEIDNDKSMYASTITLQKSLKANINETNIIETTNEINIPYQKDPPLPFSIVHYSILDKKIAVKQINDTIINSLSPQSQDPSQVHTLPILLSFNNFNSYSTKEREYPKQISKPVINDCSPLYKPEMIIPIINCFDNEKFCFFQNFFISEIERFPKQYIIVNNTKDFLTIPQLYEYIWEMNKMFIIKKDKQSKIWFRSKEKKMGCAPFVLRLVKMENMFNRNLLNNPSLILCKTKCATCPWYNFCPGCVLNPFKEDNLNDTNINGLLFEHTNILIVDWCNKVKMEEMSEDMFFMKYKMEAIPVEIQDNVNDNKNEQQQITISSGYKDKSLQDCFNLFLEKEKLDDQLFCGNCRCHQYFTKNYELDKMPHILIVLLKRFKYNNYFRSKLNQFITYPLQDLVLNGETYDLYGVVNHYGSFSGGHYTSIIRHEQTRWLYLDDSRIYEIKEDKVIHSNAYILFYIKSNVEVNENDYYRLLNSIKDKIIEEDGKKKEYIEDDNLFKGEPVETPYGNGYVIEDCVNEHKVKVQYSYGEGIVNRKRVIKETKYSSSNY